MCGSHDADHGESFVPGAGPESEAPQSLDHFKRGYQERAHMRDREMDEMDDRETGRQTEPPPNSNHNNNNNNSQGPGGRPPPPDDRERDYRGGGGGGGGRDDHHPRHHDNRNRDAGPYNGGGNRDRGGGNRGGRGGGGGGGGGGGPPARNRDDMTFREYRRYMEENPQLQDNNQRGGGRGGPGRRGSYDRGGHGGGSHIIKGMDIQALVDRLQRANNQAGVGRELELARDKHREVFDSGKALTAIISSVARRRNMNLAKAIWDWIDHVGIPKNTFHYNSMISACEKVKDYRKALHLLDEMKHKNIAKNEVTYVYDNRCCWNNTLSFLSCRLTNPCVSLIFRTVFQVPFRRVRNAGSGELLWSCSTA